jgi:hypothetical protein
VFAATGRIQTAFIPATKLVTRLNLCPAGTVYMFAIVAAELLNRIRWQSSGAKLIPKTNMISNETTLLMLKYSDKILEVIDRRDVFTRGDLQDAIEAIVLGILNERK